MKKTPYEAACEKLGKDPNKLPDTTGMNPKRAARVIAEHKLDIIHEATVGDWEPDFSDPGKLKWTPWLRWVPSLGAFVYAYTGYSYTITYLGARFWFPDSTTAREFGENNIELINDLQRPGK